MNAVSTKRAEQAQRRRAAIIEAALEEFLANGFAATKVDDVAKRAGVAKGTIYLYFPDKESLFEGMVRSVLIPGAEQLEAMVRPDFSLRQLLEQMYVPLGSKLAASRVGDVARLAISEAFRFPRIAEFYYREVLKPFHDKQRIVLARAAADGELAVREVAEFPQLVDGVMLVAILWHGLFEKFEQLDMDGLFRTQSLLLLRQPEAS